jgi:hypothetical protein
VHLLPRSLSIEFMILDNYFPYGFDKSQREKRAAEDDELLIHLK